MRTESKETVRLRGEILRVIRCSRDYGATVFEIAALLRCSTEVVRWRVRELCRSRAIRFVTDEVNGNLYVSKRRAYERTYKESQIYVAAAKSLRGV